VVWWDSNLWFRRLHYLYVHIRLELYLSLSLYIIGVRARFELSILFPFSKITNSRPYVVSSLSLHLVIQNDIFAFPCQELHPLFPRTYVGNNNDRRRIA
jgi:hypothetical protein